MTEPLVATDSKLLGHFRDSGSILAAAVDASAQLQIESEFVHPRVTGGLVGSGCELIPRNRGRRTPVAPLLHLCEGLWVWLGYHEEWYEERRIGKSPSLFVQICRAFDPLWTKKQRVQASDVPR